MKVSDFPADDATCEFVRHVIGGNVVMAAATQGNSDAETLAIRAILASAAFLARAVARLPAEVYSPVEWQMAERLASLLAAMVESERAARAELN